MDLSKESPNGSGANASKVSSRTASTFLLTAAEPNITKKSEAQEKLAGIGRGGRKHAKNEWKGEVDHLLFLGTIFLMHFIKRRMEVSAIEPTITSQPRPQHIFRPARFTVNTTGKLPLVVFGDGMFLNKNSEKYAAKIAPSWG